MIKKKNGNILVAGSKDGSIIVWEIGDDEVMYSAKVHEDEVSCLALSGMESKPYTQKNHLQLFVLCIFLFSFFFCKIGKIFMFLEVYFVLQTNFVQFN